MVKSVLQWLKDWTPTILCVCFIMSGCVYAVKSTHDYKVKYAAEHNCRWDYNDMCYTYEQRPWLWNKTDD